MLYVIASPIGNLGDITIRALEVLRQVDLIAAEDTRHTSVLLHRYEIRKPLTSLHEHNEARRTAELVERLRAGASIALLTDAGMPSVSDPGFRLITACREADLPLTIIPGPSAVLTALVGSGLPTHAFYFGGFLPVKSGQRSRELSAAIARNCTSIYFESPHRLQKSLAELEVLAPAHAVCVARELTKRFETFHRGTAQELRKHFSDHPPRGEITLVIAPASKLGDRDKGEAGNSRMA
ncbi:MAG: rRNA (cytidine1402-2-O)-methyltransferase [Verrucomicrobiota bacterium]